MSKKPPKRKRCLRCKKRKAIKFFGISRSRDDGHNPYCKSCVLIMVHAHRERKREMKRAVRRILALRPPERKPLKVSIPPVLKVKNAIKDGYTTREEIKRVTKLKWDELGDILLDLTYESKVLRMIRTRSGERYFQFRNRVEMSEAA